MSSQRERREELKEIRRSGKRTQPTQRERTRREELKTIRTTSAQPRRISDLNKSINQLEGDVDRLRTQVNLTAQQSRDMKQAVDELKQVRQYIQSGQLDTSEIEETAEKIEKIKQEINKKRPKGSWYGERPTIDFHTITQSLYEKSNYPSQDEIDAALEKYGIAAKDQFGPRTVGEALTRFAYATAEVIQGGVTEATLGLAYDPKSTERRYAVPLQIAGGLATPTALDYAVGAVIAKLGVTAKGRKLLKKIRGLLESGDDIPSGLSADELRQVEKMFGSAPMSTHDLRNLPPATLRTIEEVADYYAKHPYSYTAGAAYVPPEKILFDEWMDIYGYEADEFIDFLATYGDELDIDPAILTSTLFRLSLPDAIDVLDSTVVDIPTEYRDAADSFLEQRIDEVGASNYQELVEKTVPDITDITNIIEETEQEEEQIPVTIPVTEMIQEPTPPSTPEEPKPPSTPSITPPPVLTKKEQEAMRRIRLQLFNGPKDVYDVNFKHKRGGDQSVSVEARSFVEAMNKAQRKRRLTKRHPHEVELIKKG